MSNGARYTRYDNARLLESTERREVITLKPTILIILGSVRQGRRGEVVAQYVWREAKKRSDAEYEFTDLREWPLPDLDSPFQTSHSDYRALVQQWASEIGRADGFIIVTPEYNHGYPGNLKNAIDHVRQEWQRKAVAFVSYGGVAGGARVVEQLRQVVIGLEMASTPLAITMPNIQDLFDSSGEIRDKSYERRVSAVLDELVWWTSALKTARQAK